MMRELKASPREPNRPRPKLTGIIWYGGAMQIVTQNYANYFYVFVESHNSPYI